MCVFGCAATNTKLRDPYRIKKMARLHLSRIFSQRRTVKIAHKDGVSFTFCIVFVFCFVEFSLSLVCIWEQEEPKIISADFVNNMRGQYFDDNDYFKKSI